MNTFEQLIAALAAFSINNNNWHEKCQALKILLENTNMNGYVRHRKDTDCLIETLYIWENADPDNDLEVLINSMDSVTWNVKIILNNQIVKVIGLRPL